MRLVQVTKDTTMPVSGYEHHTWQCSGCSIVEQRMTFTREKTPTQPVPVESAQIMLVVEPTQAVPVKPIQTASVESTQIVLLEPTHPEPPAAMSKMNARAKALEAKIRSLKERANAAREAASKTARPTQSINRDWDNKSRSAPPPSASSEVPSHVKPDEPMRSPTEPIASPAPISSHDEPRMPGSNAPVATKFRKRLGELVRAMRRRESSKVHFNQLSTP
jgi:hypothetical protein